MVGTMRQQPMRACTGMSAAYRLYTGTTEGDAVDLCAADSDGEWQMQVLPEGGESTDGTWVQKSHHKYQE